MRNNMESGVEMQGGNYSLALPDNVIRMLDSRDKVGLRAYFSDARASLDRIEDLVGEAEE